MKKLLPISIIVIFFLTFFGVDLPDLPDGEVLAFEKTSSFSSNKAEIASQIVKIEEVKTTKKKSSSSSSKNKTITSTDDVDKLVAITIQASSICYGDRQGQQIQFICVHYTAVDGDTARGECNNFANSPRAAGAHFFVDDKEICRSIPEDKSAYAVGGNMYSWRDNINNGGSFYNVCTNKNSVSIEMCDPIKDGKLSSNPDVIENTIKLVRALAAKYNVSYDHVIRHFDVNAKACPAYWINPSNASLQSFMAQYNIANEGQQGWDAFKAKLLR